MEVRQFPELSHRREVSQVSGAPQSRSSFQAGMGSGKAGQVKILQLDAVQSPQSRQLWVRAVFSNELEGQPTAISGGVDGAGVRPLVLEQELFRFLAQPQFPKPVISSISFPMLVPRRSSIFGRGSVRSVRG